MSSKIILALLLAIFFVGIANAGTVSFTGTCQSSLLQGNVLNFTLSNTGNDTAYNLLLSPIISGGHPQNSTYSANSLPPGASSVFFITLSNIVRQGAYVNYLIATYQQGTDVFTALFPCATNIGKPTTSSVYLTVNTFTNGTASLMNVSVINGAKGNQTVNVSAIFPPSFKFITKSSYLVNLGAFATQRLQFEVLYPQTQASYTGAIAEQYVSGNLSYASFAPVVISENQTKSKGGTNWFLVYSVVFVVAIIVLIGRSILKNKNGPRFQEPKAPD